MPSFNSRSPLVNLDFESIHSIDTSNLTQIHSLWSVFNKCADAMEDGKRLENLSWRIYSRETFCCAPESKSPRSATLDRKRKESSPKELPELSSSLDSTTSSEDDVLEMSICTSKRADAKRQAAVPDNRNRKEKHISSIDLEKIVSTIKEKQEIVPLSPLPSSLTPAEPANQTVHRVAPPEPAPQASSPVPSKARIIPESSNSTVGTMASQYSDFSPPSPSAETASTELSSTSIVRGFSKDHISSSARSRVQLAPSQPILKASPMMRARPQPKSKGATFMLGGSSGEPDSSYEGGSFATGGRSSLSEGLRKSAGKKTTSFNEEVATRTIQDRPYESEDVFEETDEEEEEEEEEHSGSAIEDDDVDWEDDDEEPSSPASLNEKEMFQRVDSVPNLVSRRSMLTSLMHEKDRAGALMQNAANSRSSPAIRRSRTTSPNGPLGTSPPKSIAQGLAQPTRARPIIMTTSNTHPPALSPRTTRRNMLSTELTESLRKHLLWERQVKSSTTNAALKRRHTAHDMKNLQHYPGENHAATYLAPTQTQNTNSWSNNYFDTGLQEYHQKGW